MRKYAPNNDNRQQKQIADTDKIQARSREWRVVFIIFIRMG
jgi:hypothetical protein